MSFKGEFTVGSVICYILCIGIMLFLGGLRINSYLESSKNEEALSGASSLGAAISQYHFETGSYPSSLTDLTTTKGQYGPWILVLPKDPWNKGANFQYLHDNTRFAVFSVGKNGGANSSLKKISSDDLGYLGK